MNHAEIIESEFRKRSLRPFGVIILTPNDARSVIRRAEQNGVGILGIDAFLLHADGGTQPSMEHSCDYSYHEHRSGSVWNEAVAFVEKNAALGFMFEVVLDKGLHSELTPNQSTDPMP